MTRRVAGQAREGEKPSLLGTRPPSGRPLSRASPACSAAQSAAPASPDAAEPGWALQLDAAARVRCSSARPASAAAGSGSPSLGLRAGLRQVGRAGAGGGLRPGELSHPSSGVRDESGHGSSGVAGTPILKPFVMSSSTRPGRPATAIGLCRPPRVVAAEPHASVPPEQKAEREYAEQCYSVRTQKPTSPAAL